MHCQNVVNFKINKTKNEEIAKQQKQKQKQQKCKDRIEMQMTKREYGKIISCSVHYISARTGKINVKKLVINF